MSDHWSHGYVTEIDYTHGYYSELNPVRLTWALASKGVQAPKIGNACELGFGQGLSTILHSAGSATNWWATDFNPSQANRAQVMAAVSGADAQLCEQSFEEFCSRSDLPEFDFIGLHGIWTWISDENRKIVVDFARRKLKTGGVLYNSYNTLPGWSGPAPMRSLIAQHGAIMGAPGDAIPDKLNNALEFTEKLFELNPAYIRMHPYVMDRLKKLKEQNRNYLAHEYFTEDWEPMYVSDMARWLQSAKLSFAGSAHFFDHVDAINLTADQQAFMAEIPDPIFRETIRDYMVNQQFRRDYWVKGPQILSRLDQVETMQNQRVILSQKRENVELKAAGALGEAAMNEEVYNPILDYLADHTPRTLAEIQGHLAGRSINFGQIIQAITVLMGNMAITPAQDIGVTERSSGQCEKLNSYLMDLARGSGDVAYLASPVTGGGVAVPRFSQLFLRALHDGQQTADGWAETTWKIIADQGQSIMKEGKTLETPEENLAELKSQAATFAEDTLPLLQALKVA